jgi:group I intron endonuclease
MNTGIYVITNTVNGKEYVGSTTKLHKRWGQHKTELKFNRHFNSLLQNAWNKYGESSFSYRIVENCDKDELLVREELWMIKLESHKKMGGYNLCEKPMASRLGCKASPETILKMSKSLSGTNHPMWGKHLKFSTKKKLRDLQLGIPKPNSGPKKRYKVISPLGKKVELFGLRKFCRENNLIHSMFWRVVVGKQKEYKGWKFCRPVSR